MSVIFVTLFTSQVHAVAMTNVMLRLDRQAPSSPIAGLFCATPSTAGAGTEGRIAIDFPSGFAISTNASSWTTDTATLPSGATPWPGIGATALSVSGTTVTFASSDLTSDTDNYCFTFASSSSTTSTTSANKTGTVTTKTSGNTTIDTSIYALSVGTDQVTIQGTVPAVPSDFTTTIQAFPEDFPIREGLTIPYLIKYSSSLQYPTNVTLEASWSLGTIDGVGVPTVETLSYVPGSAQKAYNNTPAVVDVANRKITWTIPLLPGNNQEFSVIFSLKTTHIYTGKLPVTFTASSRVLGPGTASPFATATSIYRYGVPSSRPTATPGPTATGTPTPTPIPPVVAVTNIRIPTITADKATVRVSLSAPGGVSLRYGTNYKQFSQRLISAAYQTTHNLTLADLLPGTTYYFQVQTTSPEGKNTYSDIYTFTTAEKSTPVQITPYSLVVTSQKVLLLNTATLDDQTSLPTVVLPQDTPYEFHFALQDKRTIKQIMARIEDYNVLGITTSVFAQDFIAEMQSPLYETTTGVFTGRLQSPRRTGSYVLTAQISDQSGNITEETLVKIRVTDPFLLQSSDNNPVEHARVLLSRYNPKTQIYETLTSLPYPNPLFSEASGIVPAVLPLGAYEARITHPLFKERVIRFTIGINERDDYPVIDLSQQPFSAMAYLSYIRDTLFDTITTSSSYLQFLSESSRTNLLLSVLSFLLFSFLSLLLLSARLHVSLFHLPSYIRNTISLILKRNQYIQLQVLTGTTPVKFAHVITKQYQTFTNTQGVCLLTIPHTDQIVIKVKKSGYQTFEQTLMLPNKVHKLRITLIPETRYHPVLQAEKRLVTSGAVGIAELWIAISFVVCFILGFSQTILLLVVTMLNATLLFLRSISETKVAHSGKDYEAV